LYGVGSHPHCKLQKRAHSTRKVYQLLAQGWCFSAGIPASSTTKIGRNDIAEILLKVTLKHQKSTKNTLSKQLVNFASRVRPFL
jgi:hypothetical protein